MMRRSNEYQGSFDQYLKTQFVLLLSFECPSNEIMFEQAVISSRRLDSILKEDQ